MDTYGNNFKAKNTKLRDSFFASSDNRELLKKLLENDDVKSFRNYLIKKYSAECLNAIAQTIYTNISNGVYNEEEMENVIATMAIVLSAIEDAVISKEHVYDLDFISKTAKKIIERVSKIERPVQNNRTEGNGGNVVKDEEDCEVGDCKVPVVKTKDDDGELEL